MKSLNIAVVGATGAVGQELLRVIEERNFPFNSIKMLASAKSAGEKISFMGHDYIVEETTENSFVGVDLALFAGGAASIKFARKAQAKGTVVVDNSSAFRLEDDVPLIIPEVNGPAAKNHKGLIANPNCSTILLVGAVYPLYKKSRIKKIIVSTYQAVSGAGLPGLNELLKQSKDIIEGNDPTIEAFQHQIAFNLIPHIDVWKEEDYTKEETKLIHETHKILDDYNLAISPTAIRVPVLRSHSESIHIEFENQITADEARAILNKTDRIVVKDDPKNNIYPMPIEVAGSDDIYVGRIRNDLYNKNALNIWACFDQIRKGAATNSIQIAELLLENKWI